VNRLRLTATPASGQQRPQVSEQTGVAYADVMSGSWHVWLDGLDYADAVLYRADNASFIVDAGEDNTYDVDLVY